MNLTATKINYNDFTLIPHDDMTCTLQHHNVVIATLPNLNAALQAANALHAAKDWGYCASCKNS